MALTTSRSNSSPSPTYTSSRTPNDLSRCTRTPRAARAALATGPLISLIQLKIGGHQAGLSRNAGQLAGSGEDGHCLGVGSGRLWPLAVVGTLGGEVAHLALDRAGKGAQPPSRKPFGQDLGDCQPARGGDLVRGKTAGG